MVAELLLMFNFIGGQTGFNPYWVNSERVSYSFSAVSLSGRCDYNDGAYDDNYLYFVQSTFTFNFNLLSNSNDFYVLQLRQILSEHQLYIDDNYVQTRVELIELNSPLVEYNFSHSNITDMARLGVYVDLDVDYSQLEVYVLENTSISKDEPSNQIYFAQSDFDGHFSVAYTNFESHYVFDTRMVETQIYEHLGKIYDPSYQIGYNEGYVYGISVGETNGYQTGYTDGYTDGSSESETATSIFVGILEVALLPINMFLSMLNFEVFGINIGGFVSSLLTIAIVVIIMRIVVSGGNKSD